MEKLYHYVWKYRLLGNDFPLNGGGKVTVVDPGLLNTDSGPDFFNAKIIIDNIEWVGNVEIHVKASDWIRHGHNDDPAYKNVILHAVGVDDKRIYREDSSEIPQITLLLPESFYHLYAQLEDQDVDNRLHALPCGKQLQAIDRLKICDWIDTLGIERIQTKAERIKDILKANCEDWEQTCFITLSRALGFGINSEPFERLSRSLPLNIVRKHSDNPFQLEALFFGQAGMLDTSQHILDQYYQNLASEYYFLARKYGLRPLPPGSWKYARTRPQNSPHRRIAWLASQLQPGFNLLSRILDTKGDIEQLRTLFNSEISGYWSTHHTFDIENKITAKVLSKDSVDLLIINTAAPIFYAYGAVNTDPDLAEKGIDILRSLNAENNSIIRRWKSMGIEAKDAMSSQALIHLSREYCEKNKCLYCRFGHQLLRQKITGM